MHPVQCSSQRGNCSGICAIVLPKRIAFGPCCSNSDWCHCSSSSCCCCCSSFSEGGGGGNSVAARLDDTKCLNTSNGISSTLMSKNFSGWNILKHDHKQKQNGQCSHVDQQLQQHEIFKAQQYQEPRTVQKQQYQIKNRMHWVFRLQHLENGGECSGCYLGERETHFEFEGIRTPNLRVKSSVLCLLSYKPNSPANLFARILFCWPRAESRSLAFGRARQSGSAVPSLWHGALPEASGASPAIAERARHAQNRKEASRMRTGTEYISVARERIELTTTRL